MSDYYDRDGNPLELTEWARLLESGRGSDDDPRHVERTTIGDVTISTVWLGLDHNWGDGPPLIFETLVFEGPLDGEMDRYSTIDQARVGHKNMCARVRAADDVPQHWREGREAQVKRLSAGLPDDVSEASVEAVEGVLRATYDALVNDARGLPEQEQKSK